jgi:hypothetical protein
VALIKVASICQDKPSNPLLTTNLLELDLPSRASFWLTELRGKGNKLREPCPKVRLSQDRLPIEPSLSGLLPIYTFYFVSRGYGPVQEKPPELMLASDFTVLPTEKSDIWLILDKLLEL